MVNQHPTRDGDGRFGGDCHQPPFRRRAPHPSPPDGTAYLVGIRRRRRHILEKSRRGGACASAAGSRRANGPPQPPHFRVPPPGARRCEEMARGQERGGDRRNGGADKNDEGAASPLHPPFPKAQRRSSSETEPRQRRGEESRSSATVATEATSTQTPPSSTLCRESQSPQRSGADEKRPPLTLMVSSCNLGNAQPTAESMAAWIPENGLIAVPRDESTRKTTGRHSLGHFQETEPTGKERYDILVIGMQEASFDVDKDDTGSATHRKNSCDWQSPAHDDDGSSDGSEAIANALAAADEFEHHTDRQLALSTDETLEWPRPRGRRPRRSSPITPTSKTADRRREPRSSSMEVLFRQATRPARALKKKAARGYKVVQSISASEDLTLIHRRGSGNRNKKRGNESQTDTDVLHDLICDRLPGYEFAVAFLRGEMRLYVLLKKGIVEEVTDVDCNAENTGIGSVLANKGGIVSTLTIRRTRLTFLTAHLEAHEGQHHYDNRNNNLAEILAGAKVGPGHHHPYKYDASIVSHHCFVCGDLNYRVSLPEKKNEVSGVGRAAHAIDPTDSDASAASSSSASTTTGKRAKQEDHVQRVRDLVVRKDWDALNDADELRKALRQSDALVGFQTLPCHFPPTFKVKRGRDRFEYNMARSPSYTDRILWKSADGLDANVSPILYEPCPGFVTSDHKPIRGSFSIITNDKPKRSSFLIDGSEQCHRARRRSSRLSSSSRSDVALTDARTLYLFVTGVECSNLTAMDYDLMGGKSDPYVMFVTDPTKLLRQKATKRRSITYRRRSSGGSDSDSGGTKARKQKHGWPCTRTIQKELNPKWDEDVHLALRGVTSRDDIVGGMMFITVIDFDLHSEDDLIGTVALSLDNLCYNATPVRPSLAEQKPNHSSVGCRLTSCLGKRGDCARQTYVNEPVLRHGQVHGRLKCSIFSAWLTESEYKTL